MIKRNPFQFDKYREIPIDLYALILPNYYWLDSSFSICYRFITFPNISTKNMNGRLEITRISNPRAASFDQYYSVEYNLKGELLFINFINDKFSVKSLKAHSSSVTTMELHLIASEGHSHFFYSASTDPFNPSHKEIYRAL